MNTDTKTARNGNLIKATKVGQLVGKGYRQKLVKLTPLCDWLEGKVYIFGCKSLPTAREIYAQLNLLPEPENLPRSRSGKKVRRHQNARVLIQVLNEIHRCYELGDLLPYSWQEVVDYLQKCSYDLDALPGLFNRRGCFPGQRQMGWILPQLLTARIPIQLRQMKIVTQKSDAEDESFST